MLDRLLSFFKNIFIYFLAVLVLRCFTGFSLVVQSWGYPAVVVCGLLTAVAFLVLGHELQAMRASVVLARGLRSVGVGLVALQHVECSRSRD